MDEVRKDRELTTADLAAAGPPAEVKPGPGPVARREYVEEPRSLFAAEETERFRSQWDEIQIGFVDEPRKSVETADRLVAAVIQRLAEVFSEERSKLETQWDRGEDVSTEDLRVALQRYRSFFGRLLSV